MECFKSYAALCIIASLLMLNNVSASINAPEYVGFCDCMCDVGGGRGNQVKIRGIQGEPVSETCQTLAQAPDLRCESTPSMTPGTLRCEEAPIFLPVSDQTNGMDEANGIDTAEPLRIIRGSVFADGSIETGAGFTARKAGDGDYRINFDPPFGGFPIGVYSPICSGCTTSRIGGTATIHRVTFQNQDGQRVDPFAFHFIIIGPK